MNRRKPAPKTQKLATLPKASVPVLHWLKAAGGKLAWNGRTRMYECRRDDGQRREWANQPNALAWLRGEEPVITGGIE